MNRKNLDLRTELIHNNFKTQITIIYSNISESKLNNDKIDKMYQPNLFRAYKSIQKIDKALKDKRFLSNCVLKNAFNKQNSSVVNEADFIEFKEHFSDMTPFNKVFQMTSEINSFYGEVMKVFEPARLNDVEIKVIQEFIIEAAAELQPLVSDLYSNKIEFDFFDKLIYFDITHNLDKHMNFPQFKKIINVFVVSSSKGRLKALKEFTDMYCRSINVTYLCDSEVNKGTKFNGIDKMLIFESGKKDFLTYKARENNIKLLLINHSEESKEKNGIYYLKSEDLGEIFGIIANI